MALVALGGALAVLAIYATTLFFALQHIGERYSPGINEVFLKGFALVPSIAFTVLVVLIGLVALVPPPTPPDMTTTICCIGPAQLVFSAFQINYLSLGFLLATVAIALFEGWRLSTRIGDGPLLVRLVTGLPPSRRTPALQAIVWNAVRNSDLAVTAAALAVPEAGSKEQAILLDWLTDHRDLFATDWLTREVLTTLVGGTLTDTQAGTYQPTIRSLLRVALEREAFARAVEIIDRTLDALARTPRWGSEHGTLLYHLGFPLWYVGDPGASVRRTAAVPGQLEAVQGFFLFKLRSVWHAVGANGRESVSRYLFGVGRLLEDVADDELISLVDEWLEDGFRKGLLVPDALVGLGRELGKTRHLRQEHSSVDEAVTLIAGMLVELGEPREVRRLLRMGLSGKTPNDSLVERLRDRALKNIRTITPEQWLAADGEEPAKQPAELPPLLKGASVRAVAGELEKAST